MYMFKKNNYCLPLATKHSLEIFSELKEIKQRNEVVEKHKRPLKQWKTVEKMARKLQKSSINPLSYTIWNVDQICLVCSKVKKFSQSERMQVVLSWRIY